MTTAKMFSSCEELSCPWCHQRLYVGLFFEKNLKRTFLFIATCKKYRYTDEQETSAYHASCRWALTLGKPLSVQEPVLCSKVSPLELPIHEKYVAMWSHHIDPYGGLICA